MQRDSLPTTPIAALPAQDSETVQSLMRRFALDLAQAGARVGGVIQMRGEDAAGRSRIFLRDLASEAEFVISQDLGPGSVACNLDAGELAMACAAVERAARAGADLQLAPDLLRRQRWTGSQAGLRAQERRRNVREAFDVHPKWRAMVAGRTVLLVDDVLTTGATVESCARALQRADARRVDVLTLARVVRPAL